MISAEYYQIIYLIFITIFTIGAINVKRLPDEIEYTFGSLFLCVTIVFFIGLRPISEKYFVDMALYAANFTRLTWHGMMYNTDNILFDNLYCYMAAKRIDVTYFFMLISSVYFGCMYIACKKLFPNQVLLSFLACLAAFSTFSYGTNGIKAGAAASLFLVALAYRDKLWFSIIFLLLSWGFHHSMQMPVAAYILTLIFKDKKWYFYGWCLCLLIAIGHITFFQNVFAGMTDGQGASYLNRVDAEFVKRQGFRYDFVIYSVMPVIMGYYVKYKYELEDKLYDIILNMYLACNGIWMLCMYAPFNNRIAYLSWFMYPILLLYPCFRIEDQCHPLVVNRNKIIMYHLGFTLFMFFIYY